MDPITLVVVLAGAATISFCFMRVVEVLDK